MNERNRGGRPRVQGALVCDRCHRSTNALPWRWPDGRICKICYRAAAQTYGTCHRCGQHRLVPGLDAEGDPLCRGCAGITAKLDCTACGGEGLLEKAGLCIRCTLRTDLTAALRPDRHPQASRLIDVLCAVDRPASILSWTRSRHGRALLAGLGDGTIGYTHDAIDALPATKAADHLRAVLVAAGILPEEHRIAERLQAWLDTRLADVDDGPDKDLVRQFARWHHLRLIRRHGTDRDAAFGSYHSARQSISQAIGLLAWLRQRGLAPHEATQDDLDAWLAQHRSHANIDQFIAWARRTGRLPGLRNRFPAKPVTVMADEDRRRHIRTLIESDDLPLDLRAAGLLVLVYGSTVTRIAGLPRSAVDPGPPMTIRLAGTPVPVPGPVADVLAQQLRQPRGSGTLDGQPGDWLFTGQRPGSHLHRQTLTLALQRHGIPIRAARNRALQQLVTTAPPPVVADLLGYHPGTAFKHHEQAAGRYSRYAAEAGEALRQPLAAP
jgi:hypothetical protein